jgi:hypothetical protein
MVDQSPIRPAESSSVSAATVTQATVVDTHVSTMIPVLYDIRTCLLQIEAMGEGVQERWFSFQFTWGGKPFELEIAESDRSVGCDIARQNHGPDIFLEYLT